MLFECFVANGAQTHTHTHRAHQAHTITHTYRRVQKKKKKREMEKGFSRLEKKKERVQTARRRSVGQPRPQKTHTCSGCGVSPRLLFGPLRILLSATRLNKTLKAQNNDADACQVKVKTETPKVSSATASSSSSAPPICHASLHNHPPYSGQNTHTPTHTHIYTQVLAEGLLLWSFHMLPVHKAHNSTVDTRWDGMEGFYCTPLTLIQGGGGGI